MIPDRVRPDLEASKKKVEEVEQWAPRKEEYLVMLTMAVCSLMVALDATILVTVLPTLALDLHGTAADAFWAGTSYLLTSAVFQPFIAALSDIFGRQIFVLFSLASFTIGSIVCGVSQNFTQLLAGRVVQGIGGGGIITLSQVIFADMVPLRQRPKYFSIILLAWAIGTVFGPIVGAGFVQNITWRWCFYINLPICGVGFFMVTVFLKFTMERSSLKFKLRQVDWVGGVLFISSLTSFLIAISWGGIQHPWSSFRTLVPLIFGICGLILTLIWEGFVDTPFLHRSLFKEPDMIPAYICALIQGLLLFMGLYYFPFYFTSVHLKSPVASGVSILPGTLFTLPGSIVISSLITRLATYRWFLRSGYALTTLGAGLLILYDTHSPASTWVPPQCIFGLGCGVVLSSLNFAIQAIVSDVVDTGAEGATTSLTGHAAAMYSFARSLGFCVGVATGGTVFQNQMHRSLRSFGLDPQIANDAEGYVFQLHDLARGKRHARELGWLLESYVHGFRGVFEVMTALAAVALVLTFFVRHHDMDKILIPRQEVKR